MPPRPPDPGLDALMAPAEDSTPDVIDPVALARLYGEPLFAIPQDLYIPPDALEVFLEAFEGPLDLLLYLIRKQNFNVLDIPMAEVTAQYLAYVEQVRQSNLELAGEYLLMAALLIEIKSRMLLPVRQSDSGAEAEDPRAELVRRALAPVPLDVPVWERDGVEIGRGEPEAFDRILLDAPCTGLGALRRRPEARWRKTPRDVAELTALQARLLDSAVEALKPGGLLVYVTCSPHVAETRSVVADALDRHRGVLRLGESAEIVQSVANERLDLAGEPQLVQLWPHRHLTDAMFIAVLEKAAE